jgi:outer membrane protein OmpA-like peptidoglycan-associated protein
VVQGLRIVTVLQFPEGDRESVVLLKSVSPKGVIYRWNFQQHAEGQDSSEQTVERFVSAADLAGAPRVNDVFTTPGRSETPGYTTFTISRKTYARLLAEGQVPYSATWVEDAPLGGGVGELLPSRRTLRGTLTLATPKPEPMPVLLNGRRVGLPALHLKGSFGSEEPKRETDYWVLADSAHPLILKEINKPQVLETIRIDLPAAEEIVEQDLEQKCRAELPGIYFAFASARLESASEAALEGVGKLMAKHPAWSISIEGHTDSIGNPASNRALSQRRSDAVRSALVERFGVAPGRLEIAGYGASNPKEPNATVEGRARNRRVELVRNCK